MSSPARSHRRARRRSGASDAVLVAVLAAAAVVGTVIAPASAAPVPWIHESEPDQVESGRDPHTEHDDVEEEIVEAPTWEGTDDLRRVTAGDALAAVDLDPWLVDDGVLAARQATVAANEQRTVASWASVRHELSHRIRDRRVASASLERRRLDVRAAEVELSEAAVAGWIVAEDGLQRTFEGDRDWLRQEELLLAARDDLVARRHRAEAAMVEAEHRVAVAVVAEVRARLVVADAARERREATGLRDRLAAMASARDTEIARRTHEVLTAEGPEVELVPVTRIVVRPLPPEVEDPAVAVGLPDGAPGDLARTGVRPAADGGVEGASAVAEAPAAADGGEDEEALVVEIAPITVNAEIAEPLAALLGAARADGIELAGWGYRPRDAQIELRIGHCGTSGYDIFDRPAGQCSPPTARPGHSEHELGLAIDFTEGGVILNSSSPGFLWLQAHAHRFGLINLPSEPWHWSTTGH